MKGLILSGGQFQRMSPLSSTYAKTMLQFQGKPLLEYVIEGLFFSGVDHIVVVIGEGEVFSSIVQYLRSIRLNDKVRIDVITQKEPGVRGAILSGEKEFENEDQVYLAHGDIVANKEFYQHLHNTVSRTGADGGIAMTLKSSISDFGVCTLDSTGNVEKVIEHPGVGMDIGNYIGAGAYIFPNKFFSILKDSDDFDDAINSTIKAGYRLAGAIFSDEDKWMDIGTPYDLLTANKIIFKQHQGTHIHSSANVSPNARLIGTVRVDAGATIEHGAIIKGPVYVGRNSYIGTNSLIRDNTVIEENCKIGFSVEIKNTHIQSNTRVGRLSFLGDSVIGKHVEVRSGVTVMNHITDSDKEFIIRGTSFGKKIGAVIGDNVEVGANAVLEPRVIINPKETVPPGVVVSPTESL